MNLFHLVQNICEYMWAHIVPFALDSSSVTHAGGLFGRSGETGKENLRGGQLALRERPAGQGLVEAGELSANPEKRARSKMSALVMNCSTGSD